MATKIESVEIPVAISNPRNIHGVPKKQWAKWKSADRQIFNTVYAQMKDQSICTHPMMQKMPPHHWQTIRWNAAWLAAYASRDLQHSAPIVYIGRP